jgi:hypothetical protein
MKMLATMATAACALMLAGAAPAPGGSATLSATLSGATEVPGPADPDGSGSASITFADGNVCFHIVARDIAPATMAHIHGGAAGAEGGPPVVRLGTPTSGEARGCVAAPPAIVEAIKANPSAYFVNVHNAEFPGGAIRGQLGL